MLKEIFKNNPDKAEMSFFEHLETLRWHIVRSALAILIGAVLVFIKITWVYEHIILGPTNSNFVTYRALCNLSHLLHLGDRLCLGQVQIKFQNLEMSGQFMLSLTSSFMMGFILAFPYVLYEVWKFIRPALKTNELNYTRGIVFWTSSLFFLGVAFGYFLIAPYTVNFFANYQISTRFQNIFTIQSYLNIISQLVIGVGLVFELPILVYFLSKVGLITPAFMKSYRRHSLVVILVLSAIITPPDVASQLIVSVPLYGLYELSIFISARVQRKMEKADEEWS